MTALPVNLDLAREVCRSEVERAGCTLITPDDHQIIRRIAYLAVAAASPLSYEEAQRRVSIYVPEVVESVLLVLVQLAGTVAPVIGSTAQDLLPRFGRPLLIVSPQAWDDGATLLGVVGHELGHHRDLRYAVREHGVVGSVLHGAAYLLHPVLRAYYERCYGADMVAAVVLRGWTADEAADGVARSMELYSPSEPARALIRATVGSVAGSLRAMQLPGLGSPVHSLLRAYAHAGGDLGAWSAVVM